MTYAKLKNGVVDSIQGKPKWFDNDGTPIDDDARFKEDAIYPVIDTFPEYDPKISKFVQLPKDEWIIHEDYVEVSYVVVNLLINEAKTNIRRMVNEIRYSKIYQESIPYTFPGDTEPDGIQMRNEVDRQNIQDVIVDATIKNADDVMYFMPVSNNLKTMTAAEVITMGLFLKTRGDAITSYSWQLKQQIDAIDNLQDLSDLDIGINWPL